MISRGKSNTVRSAAATILVIAAASQASAQSTPANAAPSETADTLGEVVVTAQLRKENLQQVPVSAQVIGGPVLAQQNRNSMDDLTQTIPAVHVGGGGDFANSLFIRGIGSGGNPAFDQSVATFIDDVYFGRSRASGATFLDLDRIEVLKGPQSTFFGNNAIAGALNIVTKKPGDTFEGSFRALYGMHGQYAVEGESTLPVSDQFSLRVAGIADGGTGWIKNVNTGNDSPNTNNKAGRITALYKLNDALDITLKVEGSRNRTAGTDQGLPLQYAVCPAPAPIGANQGGVFCAQALALHIPNGLDQNENSGLPGQMSLLTTFSSVLTADYHIDDLTLTSVSGFYQYDFSSRGDQVNFPQFLNTHTSQENYHQFSQELRVASPIGATFEYLAGVYFQTDRLTQNIELNAPFVDAFGPLLGIPPELLPLAWSPGFAQKEDVYSVFGSLSWNVTDRLKLTAGLRGSSVKKDFSGYNQYGTSDQLYGGFTPIAPNYQQAWSVTEGPPGSISLNRTDNAALPTAKIQYQLNPNAMLYFSYSKGFKAGGFNGAQPFNSPDNLRFGPEHVNAYELGLKSKWLDDKVLFDIDVFRSDYKDLQADASIFEPSANAYTSVVRNAAASRSQGVELETQWAVTRGLRLAANVTYLDSIYVSYPNASPDVLQIYCQANFKAATAATLAQYCSPYFGPPAAAGGVPTIEPFHSLAGQQTPYAPRWSGSINARYTALLGNYQLTSELSPYFTTSFNQQQEPYVLGTAGYIRWDARLTLEPQEGHWALDVIGKNLADRDIVASSFGIYVTQKEEPRNVAVQFRYKW
jgi:outer membrane receptor protein involved in Fe transport